MRIKTELSERPPEFTVVNEQGMARITFYTDVMEVSRGDDSLAYEAISWIITRTYSANLETRIASNVEIWLASARDESYAEAAAEVRQKRDQLLRESDTSMLLDRMGLSLPDNITTATLLSIVRTFFGVLRESINGEMARYRQELRDLPTSQGFPFNASWPEKPEGSV